MHWHFSGAMSKEAEQLLGGLCEIINQQQVLQALRNNNGNEVANQILLRRKQQEQSKLLVGQREETVFFAFDYLETENSKEKKTNS